MFYFILSILVNIFNVCVGKVGIIELKEIIIILLFLEFVMKFFNLGGRFLVGWGKSGFVIINVVMG